MRYSRIYFLLYYLIARPLLSSLKTQNFGLVYGMGAAKLARDIGLPDNEVGSGVCGWLGGGLCVCGWLGGGLRGWLDVCVWLRECVWVAAWRRVWMSACATACGCMRA